MNKIMAEINQEKELLVHSIYQSISGECGVIPQGAVTIILRLAGCNMACPYCDTEARRSITGSVLLFDHVIERLLFYSASQKPNLLITGGEPLLQDEGLRNILSQIRDKFSLIQIETNGTILPLEKMKGLIDSYIIDFKIGKYVPPGGCDHFEMLTRFPSVKGNYIKFVISAEKELLNIEKQLDKFHLYLDAINELEENIPYFAFSCVCTVKQAHDSQMMIDPPLFHAVNKWMAESEALKKWPRPPILNVQIHKFIGSE